MIRDNYRILPRRINYKRKNPVHQWKLSLKVPCHHIAKDSLQTASLPNLVKIQF